MEEDDNIIMSLVLMYFNEVHSQVQHVHSRVQTRVSKGVKRRA